MPQVKFTLVRFADWLGCAQADHTTDVLALDTATQDSLCIIWGHRGHGLHQQPQWTSRKTMKYFTILRDPFSRVVSTYEFEHRGKYDHEHESFRDFFTSFPQQSTVTPWRVAGSPYCQTLCCWATDGRTAVLLREYLVSSIFLYPDAVVVICGIYPEGYLTLEYE
jgi:hypothetical protein